MISIKLELRPMSINKAFQGRRFMTKEYKDWIKEGLFLLPKKKCASGIVEVSIVFYMRHPKKADIDNPIKTVVDLLVKKGYIDDDVYIYELHVRKEKNEIESIDVEIYELE